MARAPALQAGGRGFEPHILHESGTREGDPSPSPHRSLTGWERKQTQEKDTRARRRAAMRAPNDKKREASEGVRRMPWLPEAMKDAAGRESLRGGADGR